MIVEHDARLQGQKHKEISLLVHRRNVFGYYCMGSCPPDAVCSKVSPRDKPMLANPSSAKLMKPFVFMVGLAHRKE
jgi:hypothetical protein